MRRTGIFWANGPAFCLAQAEGLGLVVKWVAEGPTARPFVTSSQMAGPLALKTITLCLGSQAFSLGYAKVWPFGPRNSPLGRKTTTSLTLNVCRLAINELGSGTYYHQPVNDYDECTSVRQEPHPAG
jgi:hypothetical protein